MRTPKPTHTDTPSEPHATHRSDTKRGTQPLLLDPRSQSSIDDLGADDQTDLLDIALDEQSGDRDASGHSFADDVRSDGDEDERHERR